MKKMLITGGTVFVSKFAARYFANLYDVYVLNRNTRPQCAGVTLIQGDRHALGDRLKNAHFDVVLDVTAYDAEDINDLLDALGSFGSYILVSSSAVYPETEMQPFGEETPIGPNSIWGKYGTDKMAAEQALRHRVPGAYILRPPYLYGPGNNVYREAFCFDCALENRRFCLPGEGSMGLQFFHVEDLCRFVEVLLEKKPRQKVYNVGNREMVSVRQWVQLCYEIAGKKAEFISISDDVEQRNYFPFYRYEYQLDVKKQYALMPETKDLREGLEEAVRWYEKNEEQVRKKPLIAYIDRHFGET